MLRNVLKFARISSFSFPQQHRCFATLSPLMEITKEIPLVLSQLEARAADKKSALKLDQIFDTWIKNKSAIAEHKSAEFVSLLTPFCEKLIKTFKHMTPFELAKSTSLLLTISMDAGLYFSEEQVKEMVDAIPLPIPGIMEIV